MQVLEDARAAAHRGHLVAEAVRVVDAPLLMVVERRVEEHEVGEQRHRGRAARLDEQVEIRRPEPDFARQRLVEIPDGRPIVLLAPRNALLDLENLNREDGHFAVPQPLDRGGEQFADHHAPLGRKVRAVVHRTENHLIAAARVHRIEVVDESLHRLMRLLARGLVGLFPDTAQLLVRKADPRIGEGPAQRGDPLVGELDRREMFGAEGFEPSAVRLPGPSEYAKERHRIDDVLAEGLQHARSHETVEGRNRLPAVLFVLVGLEDDRGQCGVALDRLRRAHRTVLGGEAAPVDVLQIVLDAGRGLRGIVVQVVNMYVAVAVRAAVAHAHEVLQRIVLRDLRSEGHHLPGGRVRRHVGVREVDVVLLHRHDSVHDPLDRRTAVALDVAPLAVDDIAFGDRGIEAHQPLLDHVLNLLDRNLVLRNRSGDLRRHTGDGLLLVRDAARTVGFRDGADDLLQRERLRLAITFDDGNLCVIHCKRIYVFHNRPRFPAGPDIAARRQVF